MHSGSSNWACTDFLMSPVLLTAPWHSSMNIGCQAACNLTMQHGCGTGRAAGKDADLVEKVPFLVLSMDLPPAPLYKDVLEKNIIPQVPVHRSPFPHPPAPSTARSFQQATSYGHAAVHDGCQWSIVAASLAALLFGRSHCASRGEALC